jgi:hypothetical protein
MTFFTYFKALFRIYRHDNSFLKAFYMALREASKPVPF